MDRTAKRITKLPTVLLATIALPTLASAQVRYEIVVPEVHGSQINLTQEQGNQINQAGETLLNRLATFAIWQEGASPRIVSAYSDFPGSLSRVSASSLNAYGQVIGSKTYRQKTGFGTFSTTIPFYWDAANGLVDLDELGNGGSATLTEINDHGLAIGTLQAEPLNPNGSIEAFTWSFEQGRLDIPALAETAGRSVTLPTALNADGTVAGLYQRYIGETNSYHERGFLYDPQNGSRDLATIDPSFFDEANHTARDLSDTGLVVGERGRQAYLYNLDTREGISIEPFAGEDAQAATRGYAVNNSGVVAGYGETRTDSGKTAYAPLLWSSATGSVNLYHALTHGDDRYLPPGLDRDDTLILPKSINDRGQISARLDSISNAAISYKREILLNPVLDFSWHEVRHTVRDGVRGMLYRHNKGPIPADSLPAEALGLDIVFYCSDDLANWTQLAHGTDGCQIHDDEICTEIFLPLDGCQFVQAGLAPAAASTL